MEAEGEFKGEDLGHELSVQIQIPTFVQSYNWDCGLACSSMVLRYLGKDAGSVYTTDLEELQCGESVWTIDLTYLFHKYGVAHQLYTITLGVDKQYSSKSFYRDRFDRDERRVQDLFDNAASTGVHVDKRSLSIADILEHLRTHNVMICLVDWSYLQCIWCDRKTCHCFSCLPRCCSSYQGHYVVVCGYDWKKRRIFYKNPAYDEDLCCSSFEMFDKARKSHGTDEDTLFIYKEAPVT